MMEYNYKERKKEKKIIEQKEIVSDGFTFGWNYRQVVTFILHSSINKIRCSRLIDF